MAFINGIDDLKESMTYKRYSKGLKNQKWLTDVTDFKYCNSQKAYLSSILDIHGKSIVAYVLGHSKNANPF